jgi:hypothetical protein
MAIELNLNYARNAAHTSIIVTDNTGTGATGYGGSNPDVGDFTTFTIAVTMADPVTLLPTTTPISINAYSSLPSATGGTYEITNVMLGLAATDTIPDGVYLFEASADYDTGLDEGTVEATDYKAFYETVGCCITSMTVEAYGCGCAGDSEKIRRIVLANLWLSLLKPVVDERGEIQLSAIEACGQWNKAAEIIRELQNICDTSNCKGCGDC